MRVDNRMFPRSEQITPQTVLVPCAFNANNSLDFRGYECRLENNLYDRKL